MSNLLEQGAAWLQEQRTRERESNVWRQALRLPSPVLTDEEAEAIQQKLAEG